MSTGDPIIRMREVMALIALIILSWSIVVYFLSIEEAEELKKKYSTWEQTLNGVRADCDRISGRDLLIIKDIKRRAIVVQCNNEDGHRVAAYTLNWDGVGTSYSVRAYYHAIKIGAN